MFALCSTPANRRIVVGSSITSCDEDDDDDDDDDDGDDDDYDDDDDDDDADELLTLMMMMMMMMLISCAAFSQGMRCFLQREPQDLRPRHHRAQRDAGRLALGLPVMSLAARFESNRVIDCLT